MRPTGKWWADLRCSGQIRVKVHFGGPAEGALDVSVLVQELDWVEVSLGLRVLLLDKLRLLFGRHVPQLGAILAVIILLLLPLYMRLLERSVELTIVLSLVAFEGGKHHSHGCRLRIYALMSSNVNVLSFDRGLVKMLLLDAILEWLVHIGVFSVIAILTLQLWIIVFAQGILMIPQPFLIELDLLSVVLEVLGVILPTVVVQVHGVMLRLIIILLKLNAIFQVFVLKVW